MSSEICAVQMLILITSLGRTPYSMIHNVENSSSFEIAEIQMKIIRNQCDIWDTSDLAKTSCYIFIVLIFLEMQRHRPVGWASESNCYLRKNFEQHFVYVTFIFPNTHTIFICICFPVDSFLRFFCIPLFEHVLDGVSRGGTTTAVLDWMIFYMDTVRYYHWQLTQEDSTLIPHSRASTQIKHSFEPVWCSMWKIVLKDLKLKPALIVDYWNVGEMGCYRWMSASHWNCATFHFCHSKDKYCKLSISARALSLNYYQKSMPS